MEQGSSALHWSPRLSRQKLRQLYLLDAEGILDEELVDEAGWCLVARCQDILTVHRAKREKRVRCPACDGNSEETYIPRQGGFNELIQCPKCGWQIRWVDYHLIKGNLNEVIALLDELTFGENASQERLSIRQGGDLFYPQTRP